ncbi:ABC transporter permease [Marinactinospora thermotolerans]|uniref:Transport permease protein n=1 Tax=Marinactinospora thermotolerans DSM 45154 TaxID=1122192 RepID=A0A1T4RC25_9ACTN|nr:ABC transporter permease [Marinactinospora thermotolerans]SKA13366.1 ABC-type multidrug transport system, permease component [Marinactinospora thermotolerans DSM 45154]
MSRTAPIPDDGPLLRLAHAVHDGFVLAGRHLTHLGRTPEKIVTGTLTPAVIAVALGYLFDGVVTVGAVPDYTAFIMPGVLAQVALYGIGTTALGVVADLDNGITDRFRSLPISRSSVLVGHTLADLVVTAVNLVLVALVGFAIGWRIDAPAAHVLAALGLLLLFGYAMLWVGVLLGLALRTPDTVNSVSGLVLVVFSFLSTSFIPVEALPSGVAQVAAWNPVTALVTAVRDLLGGPGGVVAADPPLPVEHPLPVLFAAVALVLVVAVPIGTRAHHRAAAR